MENKEEVLCTKCPHCGAGMKAWWHTLSTGLVGALIIAIEFVKKNNNNEFHLLNDLQLSKTQYNNFQKLRLHGLVTQVDNKGGYWLITARGGKFLRGEISIPERVQTFRNEVIGHSKETVHISDYRNTFPEFQSEFAYEYMVPVNLSQTTLFG